MAFPSEAALVDALRVGDERAFTEIVDRYGATLRRFARTFVRSEAVADEVVQEAWLAVLEGIDRFQGRSSLKTWLFRIVANTAITRSRREARSIPFSALGPEAETGEPSVAPERFRGPDQPLWPGHWASPPASWESQPQQRLLAAETRVVIGQAIERLPEAQRLVITLRDVEGFDPAEVSTLLGVSDGNQRVLLHRARSKVRAALEDYLQEPRA